MKITSARQLAIYLKDQRKSQKMTQSATASRVGIRQDTVSKFEHHPDTTMVDTLFKIISALNLELHVEQKDKNKKPSEWKEEW
ncbi:helix-turn-helix domain-containing protein [Rouxiella sp. Mn2063]|uniref:helix-turn-helix domain-containing protein n=1 Tax=Rouxiella sp. Mn2063 TaxID=3395262 RepID=UPI003BDDF5CA